MENKKEKIMTKSYVVKDGDTLYSIALQLTGSPRLWRQLYLKNISKIGLNYNRIYRGCVLKIPNSWSNKNKE